MLSKTFKPAGVCIYCGSITYHENGGKLGDEHIIPIGLGGKMILPQASCRQCETQINKSETFCHKKMLEAFRYKLGIKGRKRKLKKTDALDVEFSSGDNTETIRVPLSAYPAGILIPVLHKPGILERPDRKRSNMLTYKKIILGHPSDAEKLLFKYKKDSFEWVWGRAEPVLFSRMLAKIAHSFACARLGVDGFQPLLKEHILGKVKYRPDYLIGSTSHFIARNDDMHDIAMSKKSLSGKEFWVCNIRLFQNYYFPEYIVIVGMVSRDDLSNFTVPDDGSGLFGTYMPHDNEGYFSEPSTLYIHPHEKDKGEVLWKQVFGKPTETVLEKWGYKIE